LRSLTMSHVPHLYPCSCSSQLPALLALHLSRSCCCSLHSPLPTLYACCTSHPFTDPADLVSVLHSRKVQGEQWHEAALLQVFDLSHQGGVIFVGGEVLENFWWRRNFGCMITRIGHLPRVPHLLHSLNKLFIDCHSNCTHLYTQNQKPVPGLIDALPSWIECDMTRRMVA
jgi:hypothetical protein